MRLDLFISEQYGFTRNKSQAFIKDGLISVDGKVVIKPSFEILGDENIELREEKKIHWVSRSAGKLDGFLDQLTDDKGKMIISGATCLDVGSSTGGFTQVLLDRGARHIDAVDVGTDQLHESLKNHPKVTSYEQMDIREFADLKGAGSLVRETLKPNQHTSQSVHYDIIVCDASFISLQEIFPSILMLTENDTDIILLWKPQFEVGREHLRKTGVPKDEQIVAKKQREWEDFVGANNCEILQKEKSSVIGEAGNEEWLYFVKKL